MKPPDDKSFPARVYADGSRLPGPDAADDEAPVLVSDIVTFTAEYRLFLLDGEVVTGSRYAVRGELDVAPLDDDPRRAEILAFTAALLGSGSASGVGTGTGAGLPSVIVVDVGTVDDGTPTGAWAVVEANAAWASGHYACDDDRVLDVVLRAARPVDAVGHTEAGFLRTLPSVVR